MNSPQTMVSAFKSSSVFAEPEKQSAELFAKAPGFLSRVIPGQRKDIHDYNLEESVGALEVFIHQARDIQNICIYHKQDVYAKLWLTSDPEKAMSTKIINGGGQNPVFNEKLRLDVRTVDTSLKCEIWMLSRVRNYLEDQLLGFALVPLSDVLVGNGKLEKEFSLSSTELFHSPAGYVQLSVSYSGAVPEVLAISSTQASIITDEAIPEAEALGSFPCELDRIEFPDPKVVNDNYLMVSECFGIPCTDVISHSTNTFSSDTDNQLSPEAGVQLVESFSAGTHSPTQYGKHDSPPSSGSVYGSPSASLPVSSQSSGTPGASKSSKDDYGAASREILKEKSLDVRGSETNVSGRKSGGSFKQPGITRNLEPEEKLVQRDFVDMYMKSMQQFTESLAKMKLPLDIDNGTTCSGDSSSDQKLQPSKNSGNRVFYGSSAFF